MKHCEGFTQFFTRIHRLVNALLKGKKIKFLARNFEYFFYMYTICVDVGWLLVKKK